MPRFDCKIAQAINKLRGETWGDSHHIFNLLPSTQVTFDGYIERVKDVVDAGDFFYIKRYGKFDAILRARIILTSGSAAMLPHSLVFFMMGPRLISQKNRGHFPTSRIS